MEWHRELIQETIEEKGGRKAELLGHYQMVISQPCSWGSTVCLSPTLFINLLSFDPLHLSHPGVLWAPPRLGVPKGMPSMLLCSALGLRNVALILKNNHGENCSLGSPKFIDRSEQGTSYLKLIQMLESSRHDFEEIQGISKRFKENLRKCEENSRTFEEIRGSAREEKKSQKGLVNAPTLLHRQHSGQKLSKGKFWRCTIQRRLIYGSSTTWVRTTEDEQNLAKKRKIRIKHCSVITEQTNHTVHKNILMGSNQQNHNQA